MAYADDIAKLHRLGRYRLVALIAAMACLILSLLLEDGRWLDWPRAAAWSAAGVISVLEARVCKKLGRNADGYWFRAIMMFLVATYLLVSR